MNTQIASALAFGISCMILTAGLVIWMLTQITSCDYTYGCSSDFSISAIMIIALVIGSVGAGALAYGFIMKNSIHVSLNQNKT